MSPLEKEGAEAGFAAAGWLVAAAGVVGSGRRSQLRARHRNGCSWRRGRVGRAALGCDGLCDPGAGGGTWGVAVPLGTGFSAPENNT